ncbi:MAG: DUF6816 family protein [Cyanobium sp.]
MGRALIGTILAILLAAGVLPWPARAAGVLDARLAAWPDWRLPAPLQAPGRGDLPYPAWFAGAWQVTVEADPASGAPALRYVVRFRADGRGAVVGERAANAAAVGRALLGDRLLEVRDDPANPNRQLARLAGGGLLESTVVGRRSEGAELFHTDELALQVVHGEAEPRVSRIETLSRYRLRHGQEGDWIEAEQWQARYPSPAEGLVARASGGGHWRLRLDPLPPESGRAS